MAELNRNKKCTKMSLQSRINGQEYEFSTKALQNMTCAAQRQLSGRVVADPAHFTAFTAMAKDLWHHYFGMLDFGSIRDYVFADYPEKFGSTKRDIYLKQIVCQLAGDRIPK